MKTSCATLLAAIACAGLQPQATAQTVVNLGSAAKFAVLAGTSITNSGNTIVYDDIGVSTGGSVNGFPPGVVNGTTYAGGSIADQAESDLTAAYNAAVGQTAPPANSGATLTFGNTTLTPGVYNSSTSISITGNLILNGEGEANPVFIFQAGSTLNTAGNVQIVLINGASANDIFWQVGSSATINGGSSVFVGTVLAETSITVDSGATVDGDLLARNGTVTLNQNVLTPIPEPAASSFLVAGFVALMIGARGIRRHYSARNLTN